MSARRPDVDELFVRFSLDLIARGPRSHLHWGLWGDLPEDPDRLPEAQEAYADRVLALVPEPGQRIADVGCGLGGILDRLVRAGHHAVGITPVAEHAEAIASAGLPVVTTRFEDWTPSEPVDGLVFAESWAYFGADLEGHLDRCQAATRPGGWLVLADLIDDRHRGVLDQRLQIEEAVDVTDEARFSATALQHLFETRISAYDALLRGAIRSVDPAAADAMESAIDNLHSQAVQSVLRGRMPERQMLRRKRYWLIRARYP